MFWLKNSKTRNFRQTAEEFIYGKTRYFLSCSQYIEIYPAGDDIKECDI